MLCILDSVVECGKFDCVDFAKRLFGWVFRGIYILGDSAGAGLGQTVKNVITRDNFLTDPHKASEYVWEQMQRNAAANGAIMRTSITGVFDFDDTEKVISNTIDMAKVTHHDERCVQSSILISLIISLILKKTKSNEEIDIDNLLKESLALVSVSKEYEEDFSRYINSETLQDLDLDEGSKIGYTFKAMGCGIVGLKLAKNLDPKKAFKLIISDLVLESGDADSNGCVCGAVLGTYLGYSNLPKEWVAELIHRPYLDEKIDQVLSYLKNTKSI
jgi:ADP-ribosylglycohydrolase